MIRRGIYGIQNILEDECGHFFIPSLSAKLHNLLKKMLAPENSTDNDFFTLKYTLKAHLTPTPLIIPGSHVFLNRK